MKKLLALLLALVMVLSITACGKKEETTVPEDGTNPLAIESTPVEEAEPDLWTHEFSQYGNAKIKIVGAEFVQDDWGDDLLRIYYEYTNTDNTANGHYPSTALEFFSITQDGNECQTGRFRSGDSMAIPEDTNNENYVQPGCTSRNTILVQCDPDGGIVKVSCYVKIGNWVIDEEKTEPFEFEIDPNNLMGAPEPFVLPAITNPTYTSGMSASGKMDFPLDSEASINGVELTKDNEGRDVLRVNLTVTNNDEEELIAGLMASVELYQDGVGLPRASHLDLDDEDVTAGDEVYFGEDVYPGETVECSALFYPRTQSPVEAVLENVNSDLRLGACFDVKSLYEATAAAEQAAAEAATAEEAAARKALVGTWLQRDSDWDDTYIFNADGSGLLISGPEYPFSYAISGDVLTLTYGPDDEEEFTISVDGDLLTMIDMWDEELLLDKTEADPAESASELTDAATEPTDAATEPTAPPAVSLAEDLIGKWVSEEDGETYVFNADGTGYQIYEGVTYEYTYTIDDDYVEIFYADYDSDAFEITIEGDTLTIAYYWTYTRQ